MAKMPIEEQVAQLTPEQQDKIVKIGKIGLVIELIVGIPWFIILALGAWVTINPPLGFDYSNYDRLHLGWNMLFFTGVICFVGMLVFMKIKYPYYSDAKYRYIKKMRKQK